jgi:hypothetical protein
LTLYTGGYSHQSSAYLLPGPEKPLLAQAKPLPLFTQNFLDLTDLFLDFAGDFFGFAFVLQLGIMIELSGYFLKLALYAVELAFHLVFRSGFHDLPPFRVCVAPTRRIRFPDSTVHLYWKRRQAAIVLGYNGQTDCG